MRYVLREKIFSLLDTFVIRDGRGKAVYEVRARFFSIGNKLVLKDMRGKPLAVIKQRLLTLWPSYRILIGGRTAATVRKRWTFFRSRFVIKARGKAHYEVSGDFLHHEYRIRQQGEEVARVSKKWLSLSDSYGIEIDNSQPQVLLLACAVVIDQICHSGRDDERKASVSVNTTE
jgi:uncharacterized protein YxjI